jgi:hypothetical protein
MNGCTLETIKALITILKDNLKMGMPSFKHMLHILKTANNYAPLKSNTKSVGMGQTYYPTKWMF